MLSRLKVVATEVKASIWLNPEYMHIGSEMRTGHVLRSVGTESSLGLVRQVLEK